MSFLSPAHTWDESFLPPKGVSALLDRLGAALVARGLLPSEARGSAP